MSTNNKHVSESVFLTPLIIKMKIEETLNITKNYPTFREFYDESKPLIYKTLLDGYRKISEDPEKKVDIRVNAIVEGLDFGANFLIEKENSEIVDRLINLYLPYYEGVEDYETCSEIKVIYEKIKGV